MGADDGMVGRVRDKARGLMDEVLGRDGSVGDAAADIEYEQTPRQHILHDGMVVLSEDQVDQVDQGADPTGPGRADDDAAG